MGNDPAISQIIQSASEMHRAGRIEEAESMYRSVLEAHPNHPDALHLLGVSQLQAGRPEIGAELIRSAIAVKPDVADYHSNLGSALLARGEVDQAVSALREAVRLRPDNAENHFRLGNAVARNAQSEEAIECFQKAISINPSHAEASLGLGLALMKVRRTDEAINQFGRVLDSNPNHVRALHHLGRLLTDRGKPEAGIACFRRALAVDSASAEVHGSLGVALAMKGLVEESLEAARHAVEISPRNPGVWNNLGFVLGHFRRPAEALGCFRQSLSIQSDLWDAHFNMGLELLRVGDLDAGWPEYEWRWKNPVVPKSLRNLPGPRWQGEDLQGRTLLVHGEQGMGDLLQMCRYAPMIAERGIRVLLVCHPPLKKLLSRLDGVAKVFVKGEMADPFHFHVPVMSLPAVFRTTLQTIPNRVPYLTPDSELVAKWGEKLGASEGRLRVGLVWAGNPGFANDRNRSSSLSAFSPLASVPQVTYYSLQKGNASKQASDPPPGMKVVDLSSELNDFSDTAAVMTHLDLIVTVDTSVAHLAGALGRPVWTLIPFSPDWRWLLNRADSPWYPTMKLYRQVRAGDWESPLLVIARDLAERVRQSAR